MLMKNALIIGSLALGAIVILAGFTPALASNPHTAQNALVPVEVTQYFGNGPEATRTMVTQEKADQIQALATTLSLAIDNHDMKAAADCINALKDLGISFGPAFLPLLKTQDRLSHLPVHVPLGTMGPDENLTNSACTLKATGEGMMLGPIAENFIKAIAETMNNQSSFLGAIILLIIMLPFIAIFVLANVFIPLRILMSHGVLSLRNGTITTKGAEGNKVVEVGAKAAQVNVTLFTGITLQIIPLNSNRTGFCFIYGHAATTEGFIEN
jgi:hypothetical protein